MAATTFANEISTPGAAKELIISADSHVMETPDLWTSRLASEFQERAPRPPELQAGDGIHRHEGGWDPTRRLGEMSVDGVSAEVLYTTRGMPLFRLEEPPFQQACFRAFNDWLAEYCQVAPDRLFGIALISLYDVDHGVQELERCRKAGLRGAMIWQSPPEDVPFTTTHYDRFWAAAQDLEMPVSLHILTGHAYLKNPQNREGREHARSSSNLKLLEISNSLYDLMFYGALDRFPRMKVVIVENEIGWLPFTLQQWNYYMDKNKTTPEEPAPRKRPPEYLGDQLFATFFNDAIGTRYLSSWGADACMWSNDYPHPNSTWPHSREVIADHLGHLSPDVRTKVLSTNVARLYNFPLPSPL